MQPRLVLRDRFGKYCIGGLADVASCPATIQSMISPALPTLHTFQLTRKTPTYVLYTEVDPATSPLKEPA